MTDSLKSNTPLLDQINLPADLKKYSLSEVKQIADELRHETISTVSKTGGHLGAGLGVIEITCALHYVFDTPHDKLIWDVGHQAYPHKILTGRRDKMHTIRKPEAWQDLLDALKVNLILLERDIVRLQFLRVLESRLPKNLKMKNPM